MNRRLLSRARNRRLPLLLTVLAGTIAGWLTIWQAGGISQVVNGVFLGEKRWEDVSGVMLLLVLVIGARALLAWLMEVSASTLAVGVKEDLRGRLFSKIQALGPAFTQSERSGELTATAMEGVEALDAYYSQYLPQLVLSTIIPVSILVFVFPLDPLSGLVLLLTAPLIPLFMVLIGKGAEIVTRRQFETLGRLSAHFLDSLQGLETLKQFGRSRDHVGSIRAASEKYRDITLGVLRVTFLSALALELIATISTAVVAVEIGLRLLYGTLPFEKALFLLILAPEFYIPLRMLGLRFHAGMSGTTAARRIFSLLDMQEEGWGNTGRTGASSALLPFSRLTISNLSYTFPGGEEPVLKNINLEMGAGERIALVGPSGGGKSTMAALLLGFIHPEAGNILVDGIPLSEIPNETWWQGIAWVPQSPYLFHDTIAANLRIARPQASQEDLETAARAAHLDGFIRSLPQGYETLIGEQGTRLSGGQAQRLALARAFLKDAPLLIMDEPTSSLDPQTESLLEDSTHSVMQGRTVITIAHRLNTIAKADRIIVLQDGCIAESGTHADLTAQKGVYATMLSALKVTDVGSKPGSLPGTPLPAEDRLSLPDRREDTRLSEGMGGVQSLLHLLSFLKGSWGSVLFSVFLGATTILASVGLMGASSWLISTAALHPSIAELGVAIVGVRFFGLLRGVARYSERLVSHSVTFRLLARLRVWFFSRLEPLAPRGLAPYRMGDLLNRILADVDVLENFYVRALAPPLVALVVSLAVASFLGAYDAWLGWTSLAFAVLLGAVIPILTRLLSRRAGQEMAYQRSILRTRTVDFLQGMADLLIFNQAGQFLVKIKSEDKAFGRVQKRLARVTGISSAAGVLFSNLGMWAVLALSIHLVTCGKLEGVMLAVLALMAGAGYEAAQPLPLASQMLSSSLASARRLFEVVGKEGVMEPARVIQEEMQEGHHPADLQVAGLTFTYPNSQFFALQEVNFHLPAGGKVAVVGPSGAGKSTLVNLLLRFWDAPSGSISLGGRDLMCMTEDEARLSFGVISQRTYLFHDTVRANLLLADPTASQENIELAARAARIHDFILSLPQGYDTQIGERGLRLSGGERQRLAIARAFLKKAPILLLDEPTANLDPLTASAIMENIHQEAGGRSLLLITHRLAGLENMDEIIVLDEGRLVERGRHAALMRTGGLYRRMVDLQSRVVNENP